MTAAQSIQNCKLAPFTVQSTSKNGGYSRKNRFLIENLIAEGEEKSVEELPVPVAPLLHQSIEFVNGGFGVKNPLAELTKPYENHTKIEKKGENSCNICGKEFTMLRLLTRHLKSHSNMKRYLCTFCGKGFNDTFDLKRHTRTHTGVRPYKCDQCDKSFTQRCSLESHLRKVHGVAHSFAYKERRKKASWPVLCRDSAITKGSAGTRWDCSSKDINLIKYQVFVCEECGYSSEVFEIYVSHLRMLHPFSPFLHRLHTKKPNVCTPTSSVSNSSI